VSVGETLTRARESAGLTVEDLSSQTRIRAGLIRQIEADDFGGCGGAVYARGHLRSLAKAIGIDGDELVAEFDRSHTDEPAPALVPVPAVDPHDAARADGKAPNWTAAMAVALVVICVLAGISLLGNRGSSSHNTAGRSNPPASPAPSATSSSPAPESSPPPGSVARVRTDQAIALVRVTNDRTWMSVSTLSGRLLFQGTLAPGQQRLFKDAKGLRLIIGNAPAVDLVANGRDLGSPRSQGNVAHVTIARGGDVQYA
jgi:transcriptional regulator with XRE-family HTH domain